MRGYQEGHWAWRVSVVGGFQALCRFKLNVKGVSLECVEARCGGVFIPLGCLHDVVSGFGKVTGAGAGGPVVLGFMNAYR